MTVIEELKPKPLKPYIPQTEESKKFYEVSEALNRVGVYGEENTIQTYKALGWNADCGN